MTSWRSVVRVNYIPINPGNITSTPSPILQNGGALLLAAATLDLFPKVRLLKGEVSSLGFSYLFSFETPPDETLLPLIEEKMRSLVKEEIPVVIKEMVGRSAREYFIYHKQEELARSLEGSDKELFELAQLGDFLDFTATPQISNSRDLSLVSLLEISAEDDQQKIVCISGVAAENKQALNKMVKTWRKCRKFDHRLFGEKQKLFCSSKNDFFYHWMPKGRWLLNRLRDFTKKILSSSFQEVESGGGEDLIDSHSAIYRALNEGEQEGSCRLLEWERNVEAEKEAHLKGIFQQERVSSDRFTLFCKREELLEEINSLLKIFEELFKVLGLDARFVLCKRRNKSHQFSTLLEERLTEERIPFDVEYFNDREKSFQLKTIFVDSLGREWSLSNLTVEPLTYRQLQPQEQNEGGKKNKILVITGRFLGPLERLVAILLEHFQGKLPFWMIPEQVRIIAVDDQSIDDAKELLEKCKNQGLRAALEESKRKLGEKIHFSLINAIPYTIVVGEKERENQVIRLLSEKNRKGKEMKLEAFFKMVELYTQPD